MSLQPARERTSRSAGLERPRQAEYAGAMARGQPVDESSKRKLCGRMRHHLLRLRPEAPAAAGAATLLLRRTVFLQAPGRDGAAMPRVRLRHLSQPASASANASTSPAVAIPQPHDRKTSKALVPPRFVICAIPSTAPTVERGSQCRNHRDCRTRIGVQYLLAREVCHQPLDGLPCAGDANVGFSGPRASEPHPSHPRSTRCCAAHESIRSNTMALC
jgi:hypothetical protein